MDTALAHGVGAYTNRLLYHIAIAKNQVLPMELLKETKRWSSPSALQWRGRPAAQKALVQWRRHQARARRPRVECWLCGPWTRICPSLGLSFLPSIMGTPAGSQALIRGWWRVQTIKRATEHTVRGLRLCEAQADLRGMQEPSAGSQLCHLLWPWASHSLLLGCHSPPHEVSLGSMTLTRANASVVLSV